MPNVSELAREEIEALVQHTSSKEPYVGMPATYCIGSDQYGGILILVSKTWRQVIWQRVYEDGRPNFNLRKVLSRRANGEYIQVGSKYGHLELGVAKTILGEGF